MTRKYAPIWAAIKKAKVGKPVQVRVHESAVRTVIQAVKKEKTQEVANKKAVGMRHAGKLVITEAPDKEKPKYVVLSFSLEWDGERL